LDRLHSFFSNDAKVASVQIDSGQPVVPATQIVQAEGTEVR
jgi:hypothetical protein